MTTRNLVAYAWCPDWAFFAMLTNVQLERVRDDLAEVLETRPHACDLHEYLKDEIERLSTLLAFVCGEGSEFLDSALNAAIVERPDDKVLHGYLGSQLERLERFHYGLAR